MKHLEILGFREERVLAIELTHLDLSLAMLGVNLKDSVVGNDCLARLVAFLVKDAQVVPYFAAVRLDVLRLKDRVESLFVLVLEVKHDSV